VEILLHIGIRHGTEALGLRWCDISWHEDKGQRYLRLWVSRKTGGRFIIARHAALSALQRLHQWQINIKPIAFEQLIVHSTWYFYSARVTNPPALMAGSNG